MKSLLALSVFLLLNLTQIYSQEKDTSNHFVSCGIEIIPAYVWVTNNIIGPVLGYSLKSKVLSYGINYEYAFSQIKSGIFTAGIRGKFSSKNEDASGNSAVLKTKNISLGLQSNLNFNRLEPASLIPFIGIVIGYNYAVTEYNFNNGVNDPLFPDTKKHSLYIFGQAGIRFFLSEKTAITLRGGTGNIDKSMLEAGIDFKF